MKRINFKNIIFSIITIMLIISALEVYFRIYYVIKKEPINSWYADIDKKNITKNDPVLGWTLFPNYSGPVLDSSKDYKEYRLDPETKEIVIAKTNSLGLKTSEFSVIKPPNTTRVFCVGDSVTEAGYVSNERTYPNLLEDMLNKDSQHNKFEVYNCGVSCYQISQDYLLLKDKLLKYKPDIVLLGYYLNDGCTFLQAKNVFLILSASPILQRSALFHALEKMIMKYMIKIQYKFWEKNRFMWADLYNRKVSWREPRNVDLLIRMADRDWGIAWTEKGKKEVFKYLPKIVDLSRKHNFKLVIICFPVSMQVYATGGVNIDLYEPQKDIERFCAANNIPFIDPIQRLKGYREEELYRDNCHYMPFGLKLIAKIIFEELKKQGEWHAKDF